MSNNDHSGSKLAKNDSRRLFFAVPVDAEVRRQIADTANRLQKAFGFTGAKVSWAPEANFHITLFFLGQVSHSQAETLRQLLPEATAVIEPFSVDFRHLHTFPQDPGKPPKVLWMGCHRPPEALVELRRKVASIIVRAGLPLPEQDFTPHVTLARFKSSRDWKVIQTHLKTYQHVKAGVSTTRELVLMESITGKGPATYHPFATAPLMEPKS